MAMKRKFSLPGLMMGLAAGLLAGLVTSHFMGWFLIGLAIAIVLVAARMQRGNAQKEHVSGNVTSLGARG